MTRRKKFISRKPKYFVSAAAANICARGINIIQLRVYDAHNFAIIFLEINIKNFEVDDILANVHSIYYFLDAIKKAVYILRKSCVSNTYSVFDLKNIEVLFMSLWDLKKFSFSNFNKDAHSMIYLYICTNIIMFVYIFNHKIALTFSCVNSWDISHYNLFIIEIGRDMLNLKDTQHFKISSKFYPNF